MKTHELKILPEYFEDVVSGRKTFEVRLNDRNYKVRDNLILREWKDGAYTGRKITKRVIYLLDDPAYCKEGFVILGLRSVKRKGHRSVEPEGGLMTKCKICGKRFALKKENLYLAQEGSSVIDVFASRNKVIQCFNCPHCGCQNQFGARLRVVELNRITSKEESTK